MTYEEQQEEKRREHNTWLDQQQHRRQDEEWDRKRQVANQAAANQYLQRGDMYLSIYRRAGPLVAEAYAKGRREFQAYAAPHTALSPVAPASTAIEYYNRAQVEMDARNYKSAIDYISKALGLEPRNLVFYVDRGFCYGELELYAESENDYSEAVMLCPKSGFIHLHRGICRYRLLDYDGAINDFDLAENLLPNEPWCAISESKIETELATVYSWRGDARIAKGDFFAAAERDYSGLIALEPKNSRAYLTRGVCHVRISNYDRAVSDFSEALGLLDDELENAFDGKSILAIDSNSQLAYYWRGVAYFMKGCPEQAIDDFDRYIQMESLDSPSSLIVDVYAYRGHAKQQIKLHKEAIDDLTEALGRNPTANSFRDRAQSYQALGDYAGALSDLDQVIQLDPTPDDYTWRGWAHLNLDRFNDALQDLETAITLGDQSTFVYLGRARVQQNMGNIEGALADYNTVIQIDPDHWGAYRNRGRLRFDLGKYEKALADFNEDVRINPTDPWSFMKRGDCHLKLGQSKDATQDFLSAAELFREHNQPEKAEEAATRAFKE